jgi:hypothetical protein
MNFTEIKIRIEEENNAEEFWGNLDESHPEIADKLRRDGETVVGADTWEAIQNLEGFADGPDHAQTALVAE